MHLKTTESATNCIKNKGDSREPPPSRLVSGRVVVVVVAATETVTAIENADATEIFATESETETGDGRAARDLALWSAPDLVTRTLLHVLLTVSGTVHDPVLVRALRNAPTTFIPGTGIEHHQLSPLGNVTATKAREGRRIGKKQLSSIAPSTGKKNILARTKTSKTKSTVTARKSFALAPNRLNSSTKTSPKLHHNSSVSSASRAIVNLRLSFDKFKNFVVVILDAPDSINTVAKSQPPPSEPLDSSFYASPPSMIDLNAPNLTLAAMHVDPGCGNPIFVTTAHQYIRDYHPDFISFVEPCINDARTEFVIKSLGFQTFSASKQSCFVMVFGSAVPSPSLTLYPSPSPKISVPIADEIPHNHSRSEIPHNHSEMENQPPRTMTSDLPDSIQRGEEEIWFHFPPAYTCFGRKEFCLITGLRFGHDDVGREARQPVPQELILLVEDLNAWNLFPWGSYIWKATWTKLSSAFDDSKSLRGDGSKYTLSGFVWAFKIWIFEAFPSMQTYALKTSNDIPRAISWKKKHLLDWEDLIPYVTINNEANTLLMRLTPTEAELATDWWQASQRFLDGTNDEQTPLPPLREPSPHPEPLPDRPDYTPLQREPSHIPSHHRASSPPSPHDRRPAKMPRLLSPCSPPPPPRDESRELRDEVKEDRYSTR
ncbi:hypothetical protein F3Y22_tig00112289pilonHSYRG00131 [Hibiscus syriacus]|uniref:Uncharacterized protein n=1 Tax=Hibiscus syriacus TaxID=106335 RepID=A0A6A2YBT0_HIBSY|nr:hypothetical protein F3Y22_tig00112289pilonHSYRG00131 [Hibiscus syriacus]